MIIGIGCDMIEIDRIGRLIGKETFLNHVYTSMEQKLSNGKKTFYSDNFAVKESVSKCFGTGIRNFKLNEVEVLRNDLGKPYVVLHGNAKSISESIGIKKIFVSISNTDSMSMAYVVAEN